MHHSGLTTNTGKKITLEFGGGGLSVSHFQNGICFELFLFITYVTLSEIFHCYRFY